MSSEECKHRYYQVTARCSLDFVVLAEGQQGLENALDLFGTDDWEASSEKGGQGCSTLEDALKGASQKAKGNPDTFVDLVQLTIP